MSLLYTVRFKEFGSLVCLWHDIKFRKTQLEVRSLNVTSRRDLWSYRVIIFLEMCQIVGWTAMANLAALHAAVFSYLRKTWGGAGQITAPGRARVKRPPGQAQVKGTVVELSWDSQVRCQSWKSKSVSENHKSVKTPLDFSLRKYHQIIQVYICQIWLLPKK